MASHRIDYEAWVAMGRDVRATFLEKSSTDDVVKVLAGVHPELRISNLELIEWRDLMQRCFETGLSMGTYHADNIEALRSQVSSHPAVTDYGEYIHIPPPNQAVLRVSKQDRQLETIITHEGHITEPAYDVYNVIRDVEGTLRRLFIQPVENSPDAYRRCLMHFFTDENSMLFERFNSHYVSLTYNCEIDGEVREFAFRKPPNDDDLEKTLRNIYDNTGGSDTYWNIAYSVRAVYVNILMPFGGGSRTIGPSSYYVECRLFCTYPNSCFYACVRKIRNALGKESINKKQKYADMRKLLTGSEDDRIVHANHMPKAESVFGIRFIVLGSRAPKITLRGYDTDGTFMNTKVIYSIIYDAVYSSDINDLVEHYENPAEYEVVRSCGLLIRENQRYGVIVLEDSHYHLVNKLIKPNFCSRCGSEKHAIDATNKNASIREECIKNIANVLNDQEISKWSPKTHIVVYDFETVSHNKLVPYSVSWTIDDEKDIKHIAGMHAEIPFLDNVLSLQGLKVLVAYFGSCFDGYFILDAVANRGIGLDSENTIIHHNRILRMKVGNIRTWDLGLFTLRSLDRACKDFGIDMRKRDYDFKRVQELYSKHGPRFLEHLDLDTTKQYNNNDVIMARELMKVVRETLVDITGIDPITCLTLSQLVYKMLKRDWLARNIVVNRMPIKYDDIFSSIPAGRCDAPNKGIFHGDFVLVDKNSLYPHVCLKYEYPNGDYVDTSWYHDISKNYPIYLVECGIDQSRLARKYAGVKTGTGVDWGLDNVHVWLWREEVEYLENRGDVILVKGRTIAWKESVRPFEALRIFLDKRLAEETKPEPNKAIVSMCKIGFCAATGKMVQKNIRDIWAYVGSASDVHRFVKRYGCKGVMTTNVDGKYVFIGEKPETAYIAKPRHWGSRVYSLSHLDMYIDLDGLETIRYGDTDSAIIERKELHKIPLGKEIGEYKIEHEARSLVVIGKKSYCMIGDETRYRLKGYKDGQRWEAVESISNKTVMSGNNLSVDMFEALASEDHDVYTVQENLVKNAIRKERGGQYAMFTIRSANIRKKLA